MIVKHENGSFVWHFIVEMSDELMRRCIEKKKEIVAVRIELIENGRVESLLQIGMILIETDEIDDIRRVVVIVVRHWKRLTNIIVDIDDRLLNKIT
jgi:hypothetical protein